MTGFLADGAYDGASTRDLLRERYGETLDVVIPPPKNAVIRPQLARDPTVRDRHIAQIRGNDSPYAKGNLTFERVLKYR